MLILIVNAYDMDKSSGVHAYRYLRKNVQSMVLSHACLADSVFMERRLNELGDLTVDWEHDHLHHEAQRQSEKFDKVDLIVIGGDMSILPWEPQASQCVSLVHMCKFTKKPFLGVGFGAFCATYSIATRGTRFYMLNGPGGGKVSELPTYPHYSTPAGTFPSAFLDYDTGDMYVYRRQQKSWFPVCNTGSQYICIDSMPFVEADTKLSYLEANPFAIADKFGVAEIDDEVVSITTPFLQHEYTKGLPLSLTFPVKAYRSWRLNKAGGLPRGESALQLMGQTSHSPVFLVLENMFLIATRFEPYPNVNFIQSMMSAFIGRFARMNLEQGRENMKIERSLCTFLFGEHGFEGGDYDTTNDRLNLSPALSSVAIPTRLLPNGPVKVDPPLMHLFTRPVPKERHEVDLLALTKHKKNISFGKAPRMVVQNPITGRAKRLQAVMTSVGIDLEAGKRVTDAMKEMAVVNPYSLDQPVLPEQAQDLLAGLVMNETSVTTRRHRVMQSHEYQVKHISLEDKAALLAATLPKKQAVDSSTSAATTSITIESSSNNNNNDDGEGHCNDVDEEIDEEDMDQFDEKQKRIVMPGTDTTMSIASSIKRSVTLSSHNQSVTLASPSVLGASPKIQSTHGSDNSNRIPSSSGGTGRQAVPAIADWVKVFEKPSEVALQQISLMSSLTERPLVSTTARPTTPTRTPQKPQTARSSAALSRSSQRRQQPEQSSAYQSAQPPRSAAQIMRARNIHWMPVNHPHETLHETGSACMFPQSVGTTLETSQKTAATDDESTWRASTQETDSSMVGTIQFVRRAPNAPTSNYKTIQKQIQEKAAEPYQGTHVTPYLSTHEQLIRESFIASKKRLAGPFKLHFSPGNSALEKGKEGLIRAHGSYPHQPPWGVPEGTHVLDWDYVVDRTASNRIAGSWK